MTDKPRVYFDMDTIVGTIAVGIGALVVPLNHPSELVSNRVHVFTSNVVDIKEDVNLLEFETEHTYYVGVPAVECCGSVNCELCSRSRSCGQ